MATKRLLVLLAAGFTLCACSGSEPETQAGASRKAEAAGRETAAVASGSDEAPWMVQPVIVRPPSAEQEPADVEEERVGVAAQDEEAELPRVDRPAPRPTPRPAPEPPARRTVSEDREPPRVTPAPRPAPRPEPVPLPRAEPRVADADVPRARTVGEARSLNREAIGLIGAGQPERAVPLLQGALAVQPRDAEILGNLGYAYMLIGDYGRARTHFERSLDIMPTRSATWLNLGQTYAELGQRERAVDAVLTGYNHSTRKGVVRSALVAASTGRRHSPAWRETAGIALARIGEG